MQQKLFVLIIEGTTRPKRQSIHAANFIESIASSRDDINVQLVQPSDFNLPYDGNDDENKDPHYTELTAKADAFFIVTPEYNHSFPGTLKRLLDSELENYIHKPIAFAGVSNGSWGGVRAIESLVNAVRDTGLVALSVDCHFPRIQDLFDENGQILEINRERYTTSVNRTLDELIWMGRTLKAGRDKN
jgi:NAD(P)H-dependent FMN reductase